MQPQIKRAVAMAREVGHLFLATADAAGSPHIAVVKDIEAGPGDSLALTMWPCQSTFANLEKNPNVSLVVWQPAKDTGYQLVGQVEDIENVAVLNGYLPGLENKKHYPQEEIKVRVRIKNVLNFQQAPHLDVKMWSPADCQPEADPPLAESPRYLSLRDSAGASFGSLRIPREGIPSLSRENPDRNAFHPSF